MNFLKKVPFALLRLAAGVGVIAWLFSRMDLHGLMTVLRESLTRWPWLLCAIMLCFICLCGGVIRWKIILDGRGLRMSWSRVFSVYFIGHFFNAFLFGSTGGDLARAFYAAQETHHMKTEAVATVLIDRVIGLVLLDLLTLVMLISRASFYISHWVTHIPALLVVGMNVLTAVGLAALFNAHRFQHWRMFRRLTNHKVVGPIIRRTLISILLYRRKKSVLLKTLLLSLAIHLLITVECYCLGRSLQVHLGLIAYLTVIPMIMAIAALPITPGSLGIREGLAVALFSALGIGSTQSLPLSLMFYLISVAWSLLGGLIFLGYSAGAGRTAHEELAKLRQEAASVNANIRVTRPHP
ncbi:MAG: flippase-like domain-containing protein [Lentisphaerae bacterium]|nr:flippase-like domain-containing protein [Lentisphaerota bacterium]